MWKKVIKEILFVAAFSGFIGLAVGFPFIYFNRAPVIINSLRGMLVGCIIGVTVYISLLILYLVNIRKRALVSFLFIFLIIGAGTFMGAYFSRLSNILHYIAIIGISEIVGIFITIAYYKYSVKLNQKLMELKKLKRY